MVTPISRYGVAKVSAVGKPPMYTSRSPSREYTRIIDTDIANAVLVAHEVRALRAQLGQRVLIDDGVVALL